MLTIDRRRFLGSSAAALVAASIGPRRGAADTPAPADPNTLFLSWQRDPTTTMTIQWVTDQPDGGLQIRYRQKDTELAAAQALEIRPFGETARKVARCELQGLAPGTEYEFALGEGGWNRFRTMPAKATDTFTFVSGGDCGPDEHAQANNVLAAKQEPQFALLGGDLAYENGTDADRFLRFLRHYSKQMIDPAGRRIPLVPCIGNHEVKKGFGGSRADAPFFLGLFDGLFRETTYNVLDFGDYLSLVLLDTGHIAPVAGEQTDWLDRTLASRADRAHLLVANHVPAYPSFRAPDSANGESGTGEENRRLWCPLFEKHNVDVVLEHHDHTFKRSHPLKGGLKDANGVLYLGDGSWGMLRAPKTPEERPYLARVGGAYHFSVHRLEGQQRFHLAIDSGGKVADVCTTTNKRPARRG